jgi:hypothetical protein
MTEQDSLKQRILDEIRRTAKANGNKPLGEKRFCAEAGISPYHRRLYFETYGEACRQAGFEANLRYIRYPDGFLEEKIIVLMRNLGKYPTLNQMQVENTKNPDFPFHAIAKRQRSFVREVVRYCEKNPGHNDILEYCRPKLEELVMKECDDPATDSNSKIGDVYLLKQQHRKFYKVGRSKDIERRAKQIGRHLPEPLIEIHSFKTDDPSGLEAYWKNRFKPKLVKGTDEWFRLDSQDIKAFKRWTKLY